jgi:hypothetical protein
MKKLVLNTKKVNEQLKNFGKTRKWVCGRLGISRQAVDHYLKYRPVKAANRLAPLFNLDPIDLVESVDVEELERDAG